jgi:hypothetical protein
MDCDSEPWQTSSPTIEYYVKALKWTQLSNQVVDCWCDRLTKLVRAVICGPVIPKIEPYDRDAALVIKEDRCLGGLKSLCSVVSYFRPK